MEANYFQGISKIMLTREIPDLKDHDIINKKIFIEIPPQVEQSLTKKGKI